MIVRDEAPVISRSLNSVKILTDEYLICDTGPSTDGTQEIIQKEYKEIPGEVIFKEWTDYGVNRSYLAEKAYEDLKTKLFLLLDADEVLERPDGSPLTLEDRDRLLEFIENNPEADIFTMNTYYDCQSPIRYPRYQILRNNQLYRWDLPYQEELIARDMSRVVHIPFIVNRARKEGYNSRNPNKLKEHIDKLKSYPNNPRAIFYVAQSYQELYETQNSIDWYEKRLKFDGKIHEIYVSLITLARLYMSQKKYQKAKRRLKKAIKLFPSRLELYYEMLILYSDFFNNYSEALSLGLSAKATIPKENDVYVELDIYEWKFRYKLAIIARHIGNKELSKSIFDKLLQENKIPEREASIIRKLDSNINITSYVGTGAAFKEFTLMLQDTLSEMGYSYSTSREININKLNIVIGSAHTPDYYLNQELPSNTILVNLEQLYDGCKWDNKYIGLLAKYRVWDYSNINISWLEKRGIKAELIKILYSPSLETINQLPDEKKNIDVLFYGAITDERRLIRETLQKKLPNKTICFYVNLWGQQRDDTIARSKIVLNIHGYSSNIFESSRVCHLLSNKAFVITEKSIDDDDYKELDGGLIRVEKERIVEMVVKYLELSEERSKVTNRGYQAVKNFKCQIPKLS
jgi:tetratricopeptide (TPR) repeat protein